MEWLEILKYTIPSVITLATAYFILKMMLENDLKKVRQEIRRNNQKVITPIRLQAYERITLFLERISPESLVLRTQQPGMTSGQLHQVLLNTIRTEFDHNVSQQVYMSSDTWKIIKTSKENIVKLINTASDSVDPNLPALNLSRAILEFVMQLDASPTTVALEFVKNEVSQFF